MSKPYVVLKTVAVVLLGVLLSVYTRVKGFSFLFHFTVIVLLFALNLWENTWQDKTWGYELVSREWFRIILMYQSGRITKEQKEYLVKELWEDSGWTFERLEEESKKRGYNEGQD